MKRRTVLLKLFATAFILGPTLLLLGTFFVVRQLSVWSEDTERQAYAEDEQLLKQIVSPDGQVVASLRRHTWGEGSIEDFVALRKRGIKSDTQVFTMPGDSIESIAWTADGHFQIRFHADNFTYERLERPMNWNGVSISYTHIPR